MAVMHLEPLGEPAARETVCGSAQLRVGEVRGRTHAVADLKQRLEVREVALEALRALLFTWLLVVELQARAERAERLARRLVSLSESSLLAGR